VLYWRGNEKKVNLLRDYLRGFKQKEMAALALEIVEPFSIFAAQLLWVAQPTLSLLVDQQQITAWAEQLENPQTIARWREQLLMEDQHE
jgi:hypothetical protein